MAPSTVSVRSLTSLALTLGTALAGTPKSCPKPWELSCQNSTKVEDLCCFNAPGGQLLITQFWDAEPAIGPEDSWTLHGLWYEKIWTTALVLFSLIEVI